MTSTSLPSWSAEVRVIADSSGRDPSGLQPGRDLVLHAPPVHGAVLGSGVLLDDWLDPAARAGVDAAAIDAQRGWSERHGRNLIVDGVRLDWIHQGELFADVFLRELRVVTGLRAAFADRGPDRIELEGADDDLANALVALLGQIDIAVSRGSPGPPPSYPIAFATSIGRSVPWAARVRRAVGLPRLVRGEALYKPHPNLAPLLTRMLADGSAPALDLFDAPPLGARGLLAAAARGGWIGHPGGRSRRHSRAGVDRVLADLEPDPGDSPIDVLTARRARALLEQRARDTVADVATLRTAFAGSRLRAALLPSDGSPAGRGIVTAAREHGIRTVHVQHGFFGDKWHGRDGRIAPFIDGLVADRAAVWSEGQRAVLADAAEGELVVTGNPAGTAAFIAGSGSARRAVVLVQPPVGPTCTVDVRAPIVFAKTALAGLEQAGFQSVVLRPHPLDPCGYERAVAQGLRLDVEVARGGPIEPVLANADACVGCLSTATLQAAVNGIPTVFLESLSSRMPWPLDGSGAFPTARTADELVTALESARGGSGEDAAREALGVRPDAVERVLDLLPSA
jgi:hypothetical protein